MSSAVILSYLSLSVGQSYAMDSNKVAPFDGHEGLGASYSTHKKSDPNSVVPCDEKGSPTSIAGAVDLDNADSSHSSREAKSTRELLASGQVGDTAQLNLDAVYACIENLFSRDEDSSFSEDAKRTAYFAYSYTKDSFADAPYAAANGAIWGTAAVKKSLCGYEMPGEDAYFKPTTDYQADQAYYGEKKDSYAKALAAILLAGTLAYSLKAEGKVFGYTVFAALAKEAYFYEKFYYENPDDSYYIQNKFMTGITAYAAIMLPFYLLYQTSEFVKNMYPSKQEKQIKEHYGVYLERLMGAYIIGSALSAGFFIAADYFVAAYGLKGTPQTTREDLTTAPAFLGVAFALTMYNIQKKAVNDSLRDWHRWYCGDAAEVERAKILSVVDRYQEKVNALPKKIDIKTTQVAVEDIESQNSPVQTVDALEHELSGLDGKSILTKIVDGKLVKERRKAVVDMDAVQSIRAKLEAKERESTATKILNGMCNAGLLVKKNWPLALAAIFAAPVAYLSYESFVESTQLVIAHDFEAISDMVLQEQNKLKYEIIQKYKGYNERHPYEWLEQCLSPNNIRIISNETYTFDDDYYLNTTQHGDTSYILSFTSKKCKGIFPIDIWQAGPRDMVIDEYNAIGENSWFLFWVNGYAYDAGIPIAANDYETAEIPEIKVSPVGKNAAQIGAGFYASGIYGLSTLGMAAVFDQIRTIDWDYGNAALFPLAFMQGFTKASPLIVETYLALGDMENESLKWTILSMTGFATALTFVPDFRNVLKKMGGNALGMFFGRNVREDISEKLDAAKDIIRSMKPDYVSALYKHYAKRKA